MSVVMSVALNDDPVDGPLRMSGAAVVRPDCIHPEHFGVVVAAHFGLAGQVFEQKAEALAWLQAEHAADERAIAPAPAPAPHAGGMERASGGRY